MKTILSLGEELRSDFPMLKKGLCYLDNAATTLKPKCVIDAMSHFMQEEYATVHRAAYELSVKSTTSYSGVRKKVQQFIHAQSVEEIVFTKGTTEGINLLASSIGRAWIEPGDKIIISEMEHHSNIVPWQMMAKERGAIIEVVHSLSSGELDREHLEILIADKRCKIISLAHISNVVGDMRDIKSIIAQAKANQMITVVDGAQAPSHIPIDVQDLDVDFYVFSGHKMYGPTGIGILYGRYELLEKLPPYQGGGDMVVEVSLDNTSYQAPPLKFEAGTPPIIEVIGLGAAIDYLNQIGIERIMQHEKALYETIQERLSRDPNIQLIGNPKERVSLIPFTAEGIHPLDLGTFLGLKNVAIRTGRLCAEPALKCLKHEYLCRLSIGLYNTQQDIEHFMLALEEACHLLRS